MSVKARVRDGALLTDCIECLRGVKQGDVCSPVLFLLFINELALDIINGGSPGALLTPTIVESFVLLFADDGVLLSGTVIGLQNQLHIVNQSANKLELKVNLDKSNTTVFRKGGYFSPRCVPHCPNHRPAHLDVYRLTPTTALLTSMCTASPQPPPYSPRCVPQWGTAD